MGGGRVVGAEPSGRRPVGDTPGPSAGAGGPPGTCYPADAPTTDPAKEDDMAKSIGWYYHRKG